MPAPETLWFVFTKAYTREQAILQAEQAPRLFRDGLACDWVELAGAHAPTARLLQQRGHLRTGRFVGVDRLPEVIDTCRRLYPDPCFSWHEAELKHVLEEPALENAGVLVYDSWDGIQCSAQPGGFAKTTRKRLEPILAFAQRQQEALGEFLLVLNLVHRGAFSVTALQDYTTFLSDHLDIHVSPSRILTYGSSNCNMAWTALRLGF